MPRTSIYDVAMPGRRIGPVGLIFPYLPGSLINELPADLFCTSSSDLLQSYDDCETSGVDAQDNLVELSFGTFKAPLIEAGRDYYGSCRFYNQRGGTTSTSVRVYGAEGEYKRGDSRNFRCLTVEARNKWCVGSIDAHKSSLFPTEIAANWTYGTPSYVSFSRE